MGRAKALDGDKPVECGNVDQNGWASKNESGEDCWINFHPRKPA